MQHKPHFIPLMNQLKNYSAKQLRGDLNAGVTVGLLLIPQGMAYAMLAGLPPVYGLYASIVPLVMYSLLGTSRQLAVGPVAMDSLFVAATVSVMATAGSDRYFELVLLLAFLVGVSQILFGLFRLGFLVSFLSQPVVTGFTTAAALIIAFNQLGLLFGISLEQSNQLHILLIDLFTKISDLHWLTLIIGIAGLILLIFLKKWNKKIPGALVLIIIGTLLTYFLGWHEAGIKIIKEVPGGLPDFTVPLFNYEDIKSLLPSALALSLIAFMEAFTVAKSIEEKRQLNELNPNKELIALGAANVGGSFFSGFPVTGGFSRSAVNDQAGAKTQLAGMISAIIVLLSIVFLTDLFYFIPKVLLAVIILVAVLALIDVKSPKNWWRTDTGEFIMYAVTLLATLFIGIQQGIFIGVTLSLIILVYRVSNPHMAVVGKIPGTNLYRNVERFSQVEIDPEILMVRFDAGLFYANADYFKNKLAEFEHTKDKNLKAIIVDCSGINSIDSTSIYMIRKLLIHYKRKKIKVLFSGLIGPVRDKFNQNRIYTELGEEFFFVNIEEAEKYLKGEKNAFSGDVSRQSNFKLRIKRE